MEKTRAQINKKAADKVASVNYLNLIKSNLGTVLLISLVVFSLTLLYAITTTDIYRSTVVLKISEPQGSSILKNPFQDALGGSSTDRYIANEIEVMKNRSIREMVATEIIDSFKQIGKTDNFSLVLNKSKNLFEEEKPSVRSYKSLASVLTENVKIEQKDGLDFIQLSVESPSPAEAALIANTYAEVYRKYNLADSRKQLTKIREYLEQQKEEKQNELILAEENLKTYQLQGGGVQLNQQALTLIQTTTQFEAQKNQTKVEMSLAKEKLTQLKQELKKRNGSVTQFEAMVSTQPEIDILRKEIASLQIQKTKALSSNSGVNTSAFVKDYDSRIAKLQKKLNTLIQEQQERLLSSSPDDLRALNKEIFQAQLEYETAKAKYNQLGGIISNYDSKFNQLPAQTLELARLERKKQAFEKMYTILEEKYQEALINEQSTPGNVVILSDARPAGKPAKPNRPLLAILGLLLGFGIAFGYVFLKDYFDKTIKTPDDVEKEGVNVLAWIPKFERKIDKSKKNAEIFVGGSQETAAGESYRSLRTRIQFSKITEGGKSILVTSTAPQEGKTTVSSNLAASFAQANKKTILLDCDLRIPRVNEVFGGQKSPGFTNYLFKQASFEDIVRKTDFENLFYIAAGTIPTNPSEILGSEQMKDFIEKLKREFDVVVIDSPPIMTITDAEILSHIVDMTILVLFAEKTEVEWLEEATTQLTGHGQKSFIGCVLNNFDFNSGYRSYNKYNHSKYYTRVNESKKKEWVKS